MCEEVDYPMIWTCGENGKVESAHRVVVLLEVTGCAGSAACSFESFGVVLLDSSWHPLWLHIVRSEIHVVLPKT